jgi:hypothetical protein
LQAAWWLAKKLIVTTVVNIKDKATSIYKTVLKILSILGHFSPKYYLLVTAKAAGLVLFMGMANSPPNALLLAIVLSAVLSTADLLKGATFKLVEKQIIRELVARSVKVIVDSISGLIMMRILRDAFEEEGLLTVVAAIGMVSLRWLKNCFFRRQPPPIENALA